MTRLLHPSSRDVIVAAGDYTAAQLSAAESCIRTEVFAGRVVEGVTPLSGGTQSVVCAAVVDGQHVVAKAPLSGCVAVERAGLAWFAGSGILPRLLHATDRVLVLERLHGTVVSERDAATTATALRRLYRNVDPHRPLDDVVPTWFAKRDQLFDRQAAKLLAYHPAWSGFVDEVRADLDQLAAEGVSGWTVTHADVRGKNLLATATGVRTLDPWTTVAPVEWELVQAAYAVAVAGGDPAAVLAVSDDLGCDRDLLRRWLRAGVVHHAGGVVRPPALPVLKRLADLTDGR